MSWNLWNTLAPLFSLLSRSDCGVNGLGRAVSPVLHFYVFCECLCLDHTGIQLVETSLLFVCEYTSM